MLGMTTALSGPAAQLGRDMCDGVRAALAAQALPGEPPLELRCLDDGYRPDLARRNMQRLIDDPAVLAVVGNVGTPTAEVTVPMATAAGLAYFAPFTGAQMLRGTTGAGGEAPAPPTVFNLRPSYRQELAVVGAALLSHGVALEDIALFIQDDGYGEAVHSAFVASTQGALAYVHDASERGTRSKACADRLAVVPALVDTTCYPRNTTEVSESALTLHRRARPPRVVVLGGTYLPCAKLIRMLRSHMPTTLFVSVSFVGARGLVNALGDAAEGVVITSAVPPFGGTAPLLADFAGLPAHAFSDPGQRQSPVALEGYLAGRVLLAATDGFKGSPDRDEVCRRIRTARVGPDASGLDHAGADGEPVVLRFDNPAQQASDRVWVTVVRDGVLRELRWDEVL